MWIIAVSFYGHRATSRTDAFAKSAESKSGGAADVKSICRGVDLYRRTALRATGKMGRATGGSARVESDYAGPTVIRKIMEVTFQWHAFGGLLPRRDDCIAWIAGDASVGPIFAGRGGVDRGQCGWRIS